jgi:Polysaccharide pyruvyl transferase
MFGKDTIIVGTLGLVHFNDKTLPDGQVAWTTPGTGRHNPNYGDMLVCAALLRQLAPAENVRVGFGQELSTSVDAAVLRGSTYLNREFNFAAAIRTVESIDAPIATVGLGAQSADMDPTFLDDVPEARRFVALLDERAPSSISVRGEFTASVLERLGARNIRVTGCPSMFYALQPADVSVPPRLESDQRRLGVSLHTGLHKGRFCRNVPATRRKHSRAIRFALRSASGVSLFEQGVMLEYTVGDRSRPMAERLEAATQILQRFPGDHGLRPTDLVDNLVSVRSVEDWLAKARELDAMIGFRFHGNMVALTQGVPCFYYLYDSRITEFSQLYMLPHLDVEDRWLDPIAAILEHDWEGTTKAISGCFEELVAFYDENDVRHTLRTQCDQPTSY